MPMRPWLIMKRRTSAHIKERSLILKGCFQELLVANELYVPSTFQSHQGAAATWRHPRVQQLRRDYVVMSESFQFMLAACTVDGDV